MADDLNTPPIDGLRQEVLRRLLPQPGDAASPVVLRALAKVGKGLPAGDTAGLRVSDMPFTSEHAFSDTLAATPMRLSSSMQKALGLTKPPDANSIEVNPGIGMIYPQAVIEGVLAHELEHIRQNKAGDPDERLRQHLMKYEDRPDEKAAFDTENQYMTTHDKGGTGWYTLVPSSYAILGIQNLLNQKK